MESGGPEQRKPVRNPGPRANASKSKGTEAAQMQGRIQPESKVMKHEEAP